MADILIKGMEMPTKCGDCRLFTPWHCCLTGRFVSVMDDNRQPDCSLVEVKPHGDLVDREILKGAMYEILRFSTEEQNEMFQELIENAPTVLEASNVNCKNE